MPIIMHVMPIIMHSTMHVMPLIVRAMHSSMDIMHTLMPDTVIRCLLRSNYAKNPARNKHTPTHKRTHPMLIIGIRQNLT